MADNGKGGAVVGRRKGVPTERVTVRLPVDLVARLDAVAAALATDVSHVVRQILALNIGQFEDIARQAKESKGRQGNKGNKGGQP